MPRASVVIPCHNSERFIEETLASALSQTVTDIEVVCVENNCTDDTLAILERIAAADPGRGPRARRRPPGRHGRLALLPRP